MSNETPRKSTSAASRKAKGLAMLLDGQKVEAVAKACGVERTVVSRWAAEVRDEANERVEIVKEGIADGAHLAKARLMERAVRLADILCDAADGTLRYGVGEQERAMMSEGEEPPIVNDPQMINARVNAAAKGLSFIIGTKLDADVSTTISIADLIAAKAKRLT